MNFNIWNTLILTGVIQGFIFGVIVLTNKKLRSRANFFLVGLIVSYSLSNLQYALYDFGYYTEFEFYDTIFLQWALLIPSFLLFYGRCLLGKPISRPWHWIWAAPFLISTIINLNFKVTINSPEGSVASIDLFNTVLLLSEYLAIVLYSAVIIYLMIVTHRHQKHQTYKKDTVINKLIWFQRTLLLMLFTTIVWVILESIYEDGTSYDLFYPLWIIIAILIYLLGHLGIYKYGITEERNKIRKKVYKTHSIAEVVVNENEHITSMKNYLKTERNFLNPEISLVFIASELELSAGHLSKVINTELGMSFKDYLNDLRIEEAKRYLNDPKFVNYTLVAIGLEAGFKSKSAFNASFKKITGLIPSQYRKQQAKSSY